MFDFRSLDSGLQEMPSTSLSAYFYPREMQVSMDSRGGLFEPEKMNFAS